MSEQFTKEEIWILRAAIEGLWDHQKRFPNRFDDKTVDESRKLMMKLWQMTDEM